MSVRLFAALVGSLLFSVNAWAAGVLINGDWLEAHLQDDQIVVVDMSDEEVQYARFHLPGAVRLDYSALTRGTLRGKPNRRLTDQEFAALLGSLGIGRDTHVVIYDDMGGLNAGRLFFELERLNHPRVSVLDGGLVQWVLDNRRVNNQPAVRLPVKYELPSTVRESLASIDDFKGNRLNGAVLLDVRTEEEYLGDRKDARSGHIPGARWWPWEQAIRMDRGFVFRGAHELESSLGKTGAADKQSPVVLYCRTGHRASQTYLTMRHLGYENVRVYAGSMIEYMQDASAPVKRGPWP